MPVSLNSLSISNIVPFVRNRYHFLSWGFQSTGQTVFRFRLLNVRHVRCAFPYVAYTLPRQKRVVAVSGESGRSTFLTAKGFDIHPGFKDLLGGVRSFQSLRSGHVTHVCRCFSDSHDQGCHFGPSRKDHCPYLSTAGHTPDGGESVKSYVNFIFPPESPLTPLINSNSAAFGGLLQRHRRLGETWPARSIPDYISCMYCRF